MTRHALPLAAAVLLTACAAVRNYAGSGPRYAGGAASVPPDDTMTIVAFNVQYGRHVDRAIALLRQDRALRNADVLLLQEMDEPGTRAVAQALGLFYVYYPAFVSPATQRDFGNAILSRYPISEDRKIILPHRARFDRSQRAAVGATLSVRGHRVRIYSVHIATLVDNGPRARREQLAAVLGDVDDSDVVVLGGDFNSGTVPEIALTRGFTWPTRQLGRTNALWDADHILLRGLVLAGDSAVGMVRDVRGASDHHPVWVRVVPQ